MLTGPAPRASQASPRSPHRPLTPIGQHSASESPVGRAHSLAGVTLTIIVGSAWQKCPEPSQWGQPGRSALNRHCGVRCAVALFLSLCEAEFPTGAAANARPSCPGGGARACRTKPRRGQGRPPRCPEQTRRKLRNRCLPECEDGQIAKGLDHAGQAWTLEAVGDHGRV